VHCQPGAACSLTCKNNKAMTCKFATCAGVVNKCADGITVTCNAPCPN